MSEPGESIRLLARIEEICDKFEEAVQNGARPRIELYLSRIGEEGRAPLLQELIKLELCYGPTVGNLQMLQADLEARFPKDVTLIKKVCESWSSQASNEQSIQKKTAVPDTQDAITDKDGWLVGRYRIEKELGRGSFGRVLEAYDDQLQRSVAIKIGFPDAFPSSDDVNDFLAEARRIARLEHPNIVPVFDVGQLDDGSCFVVSKLIKGSSLKQAVRTQPLEIEKSVEIIAIIADAINHAHQHGFVHRDLKPDNLLLDEAGVPYVCDFGLALHDDEQLERKGEISGSPCYMSPEQARGESSRLDGRSDIWSLGVILYQLVTEKAPFRGNSMQDLQEAITQQIPRPPRMLNPKIPVQLEEIILKCLEKDVRDRIQTASDLSAALESCLSSDGTLKKKRQLRAHNSIPGCSITILAGCSIIALSSLMMQFGLFDRRETFPENKNPQLIMLPLDVDLSVWIWNPQNPNRQDLPLTDLTSLPLQDGDNVRIEAKLNRPAYTYLIWINPDGSALPLHPWSPGSWEIPFDATKESLVAFPEDVTEYQSVNGISGVETILLIANEDPLTPEELKKLEESLEDYPPLPEIDATGLALLQKQTDRSLSLEAKKRNHPILNAYSFLQHELEGKYSSFAVKYLTSRFEESESQ